MLIGTIVSIGTAVPEHQVSQDEARHSVHHMFGSSVPNFDRYLPIFEHSDIETRHFCMPLDWFAVPRTVEEKHRQFIIHATGLAERAARSCLEKAGAEPQDVGHVILVTTTGTATPSLDAHLFNRLGFNPHVKRSPLWGLGCAGGAAGLSRASEYVKAFPGDLALLISVELCSLTFIRDDVSKSNIVATSLFADGAAAVLVAGSAAAPGLDEAGPQIIATQSTTWPDSLDVMGWDVTDRGLKVVFSRDIPSIIQNHMRSNAAQLIDSQGWNIEDIEHYVLHPGGMKVLKAYEESLGVSPDRLDASRMVSRKYGNMSSCTVLFVLDEVLRRGVQKGSRGLAGALGPGFSSELLLLQF
ncbi:type III polyketide synthase [Paenibacillus alkalitolerans]|uniref:type III polyketide synthase n=1 Tax=Paenibacillus alkalitolerans TaxID=2799335 RepID=UPI0018F38727|nr:3-oxoacyl-[acyl-carrier-protein] synthase III C-terminal domain-containing protein [Paenibacillus alkalitolerans]